MKTFYDLHRFWTSMSAIFGFTFQIGRMTEVLTPDIYIELTGRSLHNKRTSESENQQGTVQQITTTPLVLSIDSRNNMQILIQNRKINIWNSQP